MPPHADTAAKRRALLARAKQHIRANLADPDLDLGDVAAAAGSSPRHLQRVFREVQGEPFRDYLLRARMTRAVRLLERGMPAHRVALRVGYRGPSGLRLALLRQTGRTPSAFQPQAPEYIGETTFGPRRA
jgi:AraC-like DNA-binding protein